MKTIKKLKISKHDKEITFVNLFDENVYIIDDMI